MAIVDKGNCRDNRELEVLFVHTQHLQWMLSTNKVVFSTRVLTNEKATFRPDGVRPMGGEPESAAVFRTLAQVGADCRRGDCHQQRAAHHRCLGQVSKYSSVIRSLQNNTELPIETSTAVPPSSQLWHKTPGGGPTSCPAPVPSSISLFSLVMAVQMFLCDSILETTWETSRIWSPASDQTVAAGMDVSKSDVREFVRILFVCICWYIVSSSNGVLGKTILSQFPFPMTVTMVQLLSIAIWSPPLLKVNIYVNSEYLC